MLFGKGWLIELSLLLMTIRIAALLSAVSVLGQGMELRLRKRECLEAYEGENSKPYGRDANGEAGAKPYGRDANGETCAKPCGRDANGET